MWCLAFLQVRHTPSLPFCLVLLFIFKRRIKSGGGQILVCVAGRGYYQVEGKEAVEMKPGDCINIPAEVKHWHGAAPDEWFSHLAIEVPGENSSNEWLEPVSDEEYGKLQ